MSYIWSKSDTYSQGYHAGHYQTESQNTSWVGCYMERKGVTSQSDVKIYTDAKNGGRYTFTVGYKIYDPSLYDFESMDYLTGKVPLYDEMVGDFTLSFRTSSISLSVSAAALAFALTLF